MSQVVEDLARLSSGDGLEELLNHVRAGYLQAIRDPYNLVGLAMGSAAASLHGRPISSTLQERIDEVAAVTVTELADHVAMFHSSLLLGVEGKVSWPATIPMAQMPTRPLERSRRFRLRAYPKRPSGWSFRRRPYSWVRWAPNSALKPSSMPPLPQFLQFLTAVDSSSIETGGD